MNTVVKKSGLPDEILLGYFTFTIPTDNRNEADLYFESYIEKVKYEFELRHKKLLLFYALDFEITDVTDGSKKYHTKPKLKLKKRWKAFKKLVPKGWLMALSLAGGVALYPDLKNGVTEIYDDLKLVAEYVVEDEKAKKFSFNTKGG